MYKKRKSITKSWKNILASALSDKINMCPGKNYLDEFEVGLDYT